MVIGINGKSFNKKEGLAVARIFSLLQENQISFRLSPNFGTILEKEGWPDSYDTYLPGESENLPDLMLSIGGDGTMLETITHFGPAEIPVLGINTGRLGYLSTTALDNLDQAIQALVERNYEIDVRALLHLDSKDAEFGGIDFALNDFTVLKSDSSSMIVVDTYVDGELLNTYWADGIIVATPTGSTGYSLSCGGPIVMPHSNNFIITPVAPHNLPIRPLVISGDSEISLKIEGRSKHMLVSLDSRSTTVPRGSRLKISKEKFNARLVRIKGFSNFETLRQKLNWGLDSRNRSDFDIESD